MRPILLCGVFFGYFFLISTLADDRISDSGAIVATVNGDTITAAQLDTALRPQLQAIEERVRQLRQATLNKLIDNLLIEQAARAERISVDDYLKLHVESIGASSTEVDRAYEQSRDQFPGVLAGEAKYRIRRSLEDNARAAAVSALLQRLRLNAKVTDRFREDIVATLKAAAQEGPSFGDSEAPITIVEFSDFECPYCRSAQAVLKRVMERWPGKVRLVFKHFPLEQHAYALQAARAAVCAERQGRFWPVHDLLFTLTSALDEASLRSSALSAHLNMTDFEACMRSNEVVEHVRKDVLVGRMVGVSGTPTFFVNQRAVGSAADLEAAVESAIGGTK
jgi:protein-disulfide isomerase